MNLLRLFFLFFFSVSVFASRASRERRRQKDIEIDDSYLFLEPYICDINEDFELVKLERDIQMCNSEFLHYRPCISKHRRCSHPICTLYSKVPAAERVATYISSKFNLKKYTFCTEPYSFTVNKTVTLLHAIPPYWKQGWIEDELIKAECPKDMVIIL
jgi:hypothetical protein